MEIEEKNYLRVVHPRQSPNDNRKYKVVELPNKMKVVLIQDPTLEKSACAVSVGVGSLCDPDRSLGLAHFLEHMLFMGSENYPEHNQYSSFINNHGGSDNAYTEMEETNYFFEIANEQFEEGVKRLADFFKKPILNPSCVEKERQAVHEEYKLWTSDDNTRKWEIIHALADGKYARFSIGNQDTLNHEHILTDLREYYDKTYSSNIINAVLISNQTIEEQEKLLLPLTNVQNKGYEKVKPSKPFPPNHLGKLIKVESIKDEYIMEFIFVLENLRPLYRHHIDDYLTFILGHESEGSLSSLLESQGYISQLMSFQQHIPQGTIIGIELTLTQPGTSEYKKIYEIVMQYISQLKPEEYIYNDIKERAKLNWEFLEKSGSSSYSSKLASKLHYVDVEHILDEKIEFEPFNPQLIERFLKDLNESNLLLFLSSNNPIKGSVAEPYLGAKYKVENILDFSKTDIPEFSFLKPNKFLPVSTKLQKQSYQTPQKLSPNVTLFKKNNVCKGGLTLHVYSPVDKVFLELFDHWVSMMLKESTYDASMLDSNMQFSSDRSLWINLFGYNQVVLKLINIIGEQIHHVLLKDRQKSQIMFQIVRERMLQEYENQYLDDTDNVLANQFERISNAITESTIEETIKVLSKMTMGQFADKVANFWKNVALQWIIVGNFDEKEILETIANFQKGIVNSTAAIKEEPCIKLTEDFHYTIKIPSDEISTSGSLVYYEFDRHNFRNKMLIELLTLFMKQPFFDELRTSKQLCYIAQTSTNLNGGIIGIKFTVVSSTTDPFALHKEIVTFVQSHFATLASLTEQKLTQMKDAIIAKQCEPFKNLEQQYEFIVNQICGRTYEFNRKNKESVQAQLETIKVSDLQEAAKKILQHNISIEAVAGGHKKQYEKNKVKSKKFDELRKKAEYHPDYQNPSKYVV